ncbi:hydrogenase expression/formation C-terminal domain-containing protein [Anaeroselena agilis]|uniref:Hydrogenase expression/formation C-terminal domain-containing protein n=1 Tax=Anaeroselena agilis TaxID=3063788 RepID=A0ABU3NYM6_9FIRM|nr:hydrogenase expression/formation C-terminal domain-containing protein [Selenomonadales bacterium 4137-cl]
MTADSGVSEKAKAVLAEIAAALERYIAGGEGWTIYINKMGLAQEERQAIRDCLGQGGIRINLEKSDEPAEWLESGVAGVWYGVFYDQSRRPLLETIEVGRFPAIAAAQPEDMTGGLDALRQQLVEL